LIQFEVPASFLFQQKKFENSKRTARAGTARRQSTTAICAGKIPDTFFSHGIMSTGRLRSSEDGHSSVRSSITDIHVMTSPVPSPRDEESALRKSSSLDSPRGSIGDLELEDPLSRIYFGDEFERFSATEITFITASCTGVLAVPLLYLLVSKLNVLLNTIVR
jgi:hypothetical protein